MHADPDMTDRHARLLARFAEQAASLAEDLCAAGLAAETIAEKQVATTAFHRAGRAMRLAIALEARVRRDQALAEREAAAEVVRLETVRTEKRKAQVKVAIESRIWSETESEDDETHLTAELESLLDLEAQDEDGFLAEPLEAQVARLAGRIGLRIPPPSGEGDREAVEGASAVDSPPPVLSGSPLSRCATAPPSGGATEDDDDLLSDDYWRASG
jgi:hypothetical protein